MTDPLTMTFFDLGVRKIEFKLCEELFSNLEYRAAKRYVPALYQRNYYPYYYCLGNYFRPGSILEIGTRFAYSLIAMAQGTMAEGRSPRILSIDLESYNHEFGSIPSQKIAKANFLSCVGHLDHIEFLKGNSQLIDPGPFGPFDLIHVDGDHSQNGAYSDIIRYFGNLSVGGIMLIDDIDHPSVHKGVIRALDTLEISADNHAFLPTKHGCILLRNIR
ncbi:MAG: class I SAM-dependent methyltransferase [Verrucomicrobia bacterium]|nr:class I SAM-dependent methyltransferase [Verrucomicrobiota bacterium]